ncbi:MAG TPA: SWIM zinc finger family protein, partial [Povalibacter sp.]|nr:SWIM zinc finger family protein [Povalibacter sp.]
MGDWSVQRIEQLAPDAASAKAGQGLAKPAKWQNLGRNARLIWGECQGSGANPYQVRIDIDDVAYKCTCPSRKLPCKHTLGLLLLMASGAGLPQGTPPAFVEEWSANRAKRAEAKQARETTAETAPDPEAKARRVEKRENRIAAGLDPLETWLADIIRQGLAAARSQSNTFWSQMAARLVDAQAPGLARRVRELGDTAVASSDWQSRLLADIARLQLLIDAYRNLEQLPAGLAADVRTLVGWTQEQDAVREREGVRDHWRVLGRRQNQDEQLRVQQTWLQGENSGRAALLLEFAVGTQPLPVNFTLGQRIDAEFVFFDSATPLR